MLEASQPSLDAYEIFPHFYVQDSMQVSDSTYTCHLLQA